MAFDQGIRGPHSTDGEPRFEFDRILAPPAQAAVCRQHLWDYQEIFACRGPWVRGGAHSTRGAGVRLLKALGLSSEHVAVIGHWKNVEAFTKHYLRIGAAEEVGRVVPTIVHNISPRPKPEPERSRTPPTGREEGGGDPEGARQGRGETQPTPPGKRKRHHGIGGCGGAPPRKSPRLLPLSAVSVMERAALAADKRALESSSPATPSSKEPPPKRDQPLLFTLCPQHK